MYNTSAINTISYIVGTISFLYVVYKFLRFLNKVRTTINKANTLYRKFANPIALLPKLINTTLLQQECEPTRRHIIVSDLKPGDQPFVFIPEKYLNVVDGSHREDGGNMPDKPIYQCGGEDVKRRKPDGDCVG